jgi:ATP-dependent exoDNAse (exonuclease V) beta subunit
VGELESLYAEPDPLAKLEGPGSVQIMTIHKAKGLEFDTVIVPGLGRPPRHDDKPLLRWARIAGEEGDAVLFAPVQSAEDSGDPIFDYLARLDSLRDKNESARLLYVAATRAKHKLHLVAAGAHKDGQLRAPDSRGLLALLWPVVEADFAAAFSTWQGRDAVEPEPAPPMPLRRLPAGWTAPRGDPGVAWSPREEEAAAPLTFDWVGDTLRHVGTVVHAWLECIAREGLNRWDETRLATLDGPVRAALESLGVIPAELDSAAARVRQALRQTLAGEKGQWILRGGEDAHCEFAASVEIGGVIRHCVVDRTFIDGDGVRWIVDYKTSSIEGGGLDRFLDNQLDKYAGQLARYIELFRALENRPVRAGLYFPLLGAWREYQGATLGAG